MPEEIGRGSKVYAVERADGATERVKADDAGIQGDRLNFFADRGGDQGSDIVASYKADLVVRYYEES